MYRPITPHIPRVSRDTTVRSLSNLAAIVAVAAVLVYFPFPLSAAAILAPAGGLLLLAHPFLLPLGLVASVPVQDLAPVPGGVPLTATRAALLAALAVTPFVILTKGVPIRWSRLIIVLLIYFAVMVASLLNATDLASGYPEMYRWAVALLAFWFVFQFVESRGHVVIAAAILAVLAIGQGLLGVVQALLGFGPESFEIGMGFTRAYGSFGMPNSYAAYMEMVTIPLIPLTIWAAARSWRSVSEYRVERLHGFVSSSSTRRGLYMMLFLTALLAGGAATGMAGIMMSFSRGGWLGTAAALAVIVALLGRRTIIATGFVAIITTVVLILGASSTLIDVLEDRFAQLVDQVRIGDVRGVQVTEENFAAVERMAHWQTALAMWEDHPWLGIGVGNFNDRFGDYAIHPYFLESRGHAHNYYLHVLAETGLIGLSVYLALLAGALVLGWRAYRSRDGLARAVGVAAIGMTVALAVHNLFENLHVLNISVQIVAVWALAGVAVRWTEHDPPVESDPRQKQRPPAAPQSHD